MRRAPKTSRRYRRISAQAGILAAITLMGACEMAPIGPRPTSRPSQPVAAAGTYSVVEGRRLEAAGELGAALDAFERAIAVNPRLTIAYLGAGDIYRKQGDYTAAERRYSRAVEVEPQNFDAQYLHGLSLQLLERFAEAIRAYLRALALRPHDMSANLNVATAYLQLGEAQQALVYGVRAVRLNGQHGPARANLGAIYAALGNHQAAIAEYQQAAELMELTPELLLNLADSLSRVGRHDEAINTLDQIIRIQPTAVAFERLGAAAFRMRDYEAAAEWFDRAIQTDPGHYPAMNGLAVCWLNTYLWSDRRNQHALAEALRLLRRSLQIEPNQPAIIELLRRYG